MYRCCHHWPNLCAIVLLLNLLLPGSRGVGLNAADYFLTIGGGYSPVGNQASLEENIVFFQQVLREKYPRSPRHDLFFADGDDPAADLQVLSDKPDTQKHPAYDLLASLHRRQPDERVEYRNHRVPNTTGPLDPILVRESLESIGKSARAGDRLIVYVTAHGSEGPERDGFNTTIDCWDEKAITAREFAQWMNALPTHVPVVMVMAQCYCGGFARTIFDDLDVTKELSRQLRVGFFAQQHDLPAAGCRPDIEHDEEFSSYFWGAVAGRSRNGKPIEDCDLDRNGVISFAEAYTHAFWAAETIDIPLKTSDVYLRTYSRMLPKDDPVVESDGVDGSRNQNSPSKSSIVSGPLQSYVDRGNPLSGRIVVQLSKALGFSLQDDAASVVTAYDKHRKNEIVPGRERPGRRSSRSSRREFLKEISEKWPDLADPRRWEDSPLLEAKTQDQLFADLKELPSWKTYDERRRQIEEQGQQSERHELREVKFRKLIKVLELILLERNLPQVARPEAVARYRQMIALEQSTLGSSAQPVK